MCKMFWTYRRMMLAVFCLYFLLAGNTSNAQGNHLMPDGGIQTIKYGEVLKSTINMLPQSRKLAVDSVVVMELQPQVSAKRYIKNIITLSIMEDTNVYIPDDFTAEIELKIKYGASAVDPDSINQVLTVNYRKDGGEAYIPRAYMEFNGANWVEVTVMGIDAPAIGGFDPVKMLKLENNALETNYYDINTGTVPSLYTPVETNGELLLTWSLPETPVHNAIQLEWTWLEDDFAALYEVESEIDTDLLFRNNATRIDLGYNESQYAIPMLYDGEGKLYYRVRYVNIQPNGTRLDANWSAVGDFDFNGHDNNLNWQATTSFAEEGKRKSVIQYYDGSLRARQTVTKDNVTQTVVVAETMYDREGRAAVQVLPAPTMGNLIAYHKNLNLFNGQANNADPTEFFDLQTVSLPGNHTAPLSDTTGTSKYYSPNNELAANGANAYIPDAEGYPYTVTRYTPDATGRILSQSGVGPAFKMGSTREAKYFYGSPAQEELDGLFGTEVGDKSHYFKNMVQDANGQMSVSYTDMHGRTVATALAGESPAALFALNTGSATDYPNQGGHTINRNLLDKNTNIIRGNKVESITSLLVPYQTNYSFSYTLTPPVLRLPARDGYVTDTICYDCEYDLEFAIVDESGDVDQPVLLEKFSNISFDSASSCGNVKLFRDSSQLGDPVAASVSFEKLLSVGSYSVRKTLTISEASLERFRQHYLMYGMNRTYEQILDSIYTVMKEETNCDQPAPTREETCEACMEDVGEDLEAFQTAYLTSIGNPALTDELEAEIARAYEAAKARCELLCETSSVSLASKRQLMLMDMMPYTGQYAKKVLSGEMDGFYNIFSIVEGGAQPFYRNPRKPNGDTGGDYLDEFGQRENELHDQLATMSADDFAAQFKYSWAEALLPYHPEFDRLVFAETELKASYAWIKSFSATTTYAEATTNGFLFTTGTMLDADPFYAVAGSTIKAQMLDWLQTNYKYNTSIWQMAFTAVKCAEAAPSESNTCGTPLTSAPYSSELNTEQKNRLWEQFKGLYLQARQELMDELIAAEHPLSDADDLIEQNFVLRFPKNHQQYVSQAANNSEDGDDWSFWPATPGDPPVLPPNEPGNNPQLDSYTNICDSYIAQWRQTLLQCPELDSHPDKETILEEIMAKMVQVCIRASNENNPYGASSVKPGTPPGAQPNSFEEAIRSVFATHGIPDTTEFCNPFGITAPAPYSTSRPVFRQEVSQLDTCHCERFDSLKAEAVIAGKNPAVLSSMNEYLLAQYGDTLTQKMFTALGHCGTMPDTVVYGYRTYKLEAYSCEEEFSCNVETFRASITIPIIDCGVDKYWNVAQKKCVTMASCGAGFHVNPVTNQCEADEPGVCYAICDSIAYDTSYIYHIPLPEPQPLPDFMQCGYVKVDSCTTCADLSELILEFRTYFGQPYAQAPMLTNQVVVDSLWNYNQLLVRFLNYRTGYRYTWQDYVESAIAVGCDLNDPLGNTGSPVADTLQVFNRLGSIPDLYKAQDMIAFLPGFESAVDDNFETQLTTEAEGANLVAVICRPGPLAEDSSFVVVDDPCRKTLDMSIALATQLYEQRKEQLLADFESRYRELCLNARKEETFTVSYDQKEYHYTLYYYDQAGNLVKTVPPKGVRPDYDPTFLANVRADRASGAARPIVHEYITEYRYNSLNQVVVQQSPDGGKSRFWYDRLGRLAVSQNAQQAAPSGSPEGGGTLRYSYTEYDALGRITEVGQKPHTTAMTQTISRDTTALKDWVMTTGGTKEQLTITGYDLPFGYEPEFYPHGQLEMLLDGFQQKNLRNRVSYTSTKKFEDSYEHYTATYYTYDIHGNVDTLVQDYRGVLSQISGEPTVELSLKRIAYQYDLVSGKVNQVHYQPEKGDRFYHAYSYDAENRITEVRTSRDSIYWEREAAYTYYKHGPLQRTVLGQLGVQGQDYVYTLQGWLKGMNSTMTDSSRDIGKDGYNSGPNRFMAKDVLGFGLHYYDNGSSGYDYKNINGVNPFARPNNGAFASLYNGNIGGMTVSNKALAAGGDDINSLPLFYNYRYDQLNRIVQMRAYKGLQANNTWSPVLLADYAENVAYDPNGNIMKYLRKGAPEKGLPEYMDSLGYKYYAGTNRLQRVTDSVNVDNYTIDIDNQADSNYVYDAIGNLVEDKAEKIVIRWNVYGKIDSIYRTTDSGVDIVAYSYDAAGNRVEKKGGEEQRTLYIRDASGNVLSVQRGYFHRELHLYGSSRLGMIRAAEDMALDDASGMQFELEGDYGMAKVRSFMRAQKFFELNNHLGNVLATINDHKLADTYASDTVSSYAAKMISATDYYPFGMEMPGRNYSSGSYRYGFNGKEKDRDIHSLTAYDYGFRIYNPALGKFLSVDPLADAYPWNSTYSYAEDDPINYIDIDGAEQTVRTAVSVRSPTVPVVNIPISQDLINGRSGGRQVEPSGQLFTNGPINSGSLAPQTRFVTQAELNALVPPGGGAYINNDGKSMTVYNSNGSWQVSLLKVVHKAKSLDQMSWHERAVVRAQAEWAKQFSTSTKWNNNIRAYEVITTDPSTLTNDYLNEVNRRLLIGDGTEQDKLYADEVAKRREAGTIVDPSHVTFIQGKGDKAKKVTALIPEGYKKAKLISHGQSVYTNGKYWITPDQDGHQKGAIWKKFDKEKNVGSTDKNKRLGTYGRDINHRIGD